MLYKSLTFVSVIVGLFNPKLFGAVYSVSKDENYDCTSGKNQDDSTLCSIKCQYDKTYDTGDVDGNGDPILADTAATKYDFTLSCGDRATCQIDSNSKECFDSLTINLGQSTHLIVRCNDCYKTSFTLNKGSSDSLTITAQQWKKADIDLSVFGNVDIIAEKDGFKDSTVHLPSPGSATLTATAQSAFDTATFIAGTETENISMDCTADTWDECDGLTMDAASAQYLHIRVGSNGFLGGGATITCPRSNAYAGPQIAPCIIDASGGGTLDGVTIHTIEGIPSDVWIDNSDAWSISGVDITCAAGTSWSNPFDTSSACFITDAPTSNPTKTPTKTPTASPTKQPSKAPTSPTVPPTTDPTHEPTVQPTHDTDAPTQSPTSDPSPAPTFGPSRAPTADPSASPTDDPTFTPTAVPAADDDDQGSDDGGDGGGDQDSEGDGAIVGTSQVLAGKLVWICVGGVVLAAVFCVCAVCCYRKRLLADEAPANHRGEDVVIRIASKRVLSSSMLTTSAMSPVSYGNNRAIAVHDQDGNVVCIRHTKTTADSNLIFAAKQKHASNISLAAEDDGDNIVMAEITSQTLGAIVLGSQVDEDDEDDDSTVMADIMSQTPGQDVFGGQLTQLNGGNNIQLALAGDDDDDDDAVVAEIMGQTLGQVVESSQVNWANNVQTAGNAEHPADGLAPDEFEVLGDESFSVRHETLGADVADDDDDAMISI